MKNRKYLKVTTLIIVLILIIVFFIVNINTFKYRRTSYKEVGKYVHFSIDDTIEIFKDLTTKQDKYETIFDNKTLKFLKQCNDTYGAKFSMYCFYEFDNFCLEECTDKFVSEFKQNSEWLRFGFHALDNTRDYSVLSEEETQNDYELVVEQLKRIVGEESITTVIRMEKFICNKQNVQALQKMEFGVTGLLGADTSDRQDYYLDESMNEELFKEDFYYDDLIGLAIYNTDLRIEKIEDIEQEVENLKGDKDIIIFTHEWILNSKNKRRIRKICEFATMNEYAYEFPKNYMLEE